VSDGYASIGPDTIKRYGTEPILAPEPAAPSFEKMASQSAVWREPGAKKGTRNFIDGHWGVRCIASDLKIPTLPGMDDVFIPGIAAASPDRSPRSLRCTDG